MHFETAINTANNPPQRLVAKMRIHNGLSYLRTSCRYWGGVKWFLRIFEVLSARMSLLLEDGNARNDSLSGSNNAHRPTNPFSSYNDDNGDDRAETAGELDPFASGTEIDFNVAGFDGIGSSDGFGLIAGKSSELWLQELLGGDLIGYDEDFAAVGEMPVQ